MNLSYAYDIYIYKGFFKLLFLKYKISRYNANRKQIYAVIHHTTGLFMAIIISSSVQVNTLH